MRSANSIGKKYLNCKDEIRKTNGADKSQLKANSEELFKIYKKVLSKSRAQFSKDLQKQLKNLKTSNPKGFWEIINGAITSNKKEGDICLARFLDHFEKLSDCKILLPCLPTPNVYSNLLICMNDVYLNPGIRP